MQYLKGIYDSSSRRLMVEFKNKLLKKNWDLFSEMIKEASKCNYLPRNTEKKLLTDTKALIIIPCEIEGSEDMEDGTRIKPEKLPDVVTNHLSGVLETFSRRVVEIELDKFEFIPLSGYSIDDLRKDIEEAIKEKRDLCLIDTYKNYERLGNLDITTVKQKIIPYICNEYADIAYFIHSGDIGELKKYKSQLEEKEWI